MDTDQLTFNLSQETLLALVRAMLGGSVGREGDDQPLPPGPWDPVIRTALERMGNRAPWQMTAFGGFRQGIGSVFGPHPEPWRVVLDSLLARHPELFDVIGGGPILNPGDEASLNPQPLPPRYAYLTSMVQVVTGRAELMQELAAATASEGEQQGIIIVGGYLERFADEICGTGFRLRWPFPWPPPPWWAEELSGIDLAVMAVQFDRAAKETFNPDLAQNLANTGGKFLEAGLARMQ